MIAPARGVFPQLVSVATALPGHGASQDETKRFATRLFANALGPVDQRLLAVFDNAGVERRWFVEPLDWYDRPRGFGEMNEAYVRHALALGIEAVSAALARCGLVGSPGTELEFAL